MISSLGMWFRGNCLEVVEEAIHGEMPNREVNREKEASKFSLSFEDAFSIELGEKRTILKMKLLTHV